MPENKSSWESFLNPTILRPRLITASLYIAAFELLKAAIIDGIRSLYISGFDQNGIQVSPEYQSDVLVKNASPLYASLEWLKEADAINEDDVAVCEMVKNLRNEIAPNISARSLQKRRAIRGSKALRVLWMSLPIHLRNTKANGNFSKRSPEK